MTIDTPGHGPTSAAPLLIVEARGTHREVGRQRGEAARELIAANVAAYRDGFEVLAGRSFDRAAEELAPYLEQARRHVPHCVEELEGMAEGSGVPFDDLLVLNCGEELTCDPDEPSGHCTSFALRADGRTLLAHNEDWYAVDAGRTIVVRATLPGDLRLLSVTTAALLSATGLNSRGLAACGNTLYSADARVGVPNAFICRVLLECSDAEEARRFVHLAPRARGSNHLIADASGRIIDVETSALDAADTSSTTWLAHTNHYVLDRMTSHEASTSRSTRARLSRARELLASTASSADDPVRRAARVLRDHANEPDTICAHPDPSDPPIAREMTCYSQIWDLSALTVWACDGPPCKGEYLPYSL